MGLKETDFDDSLWFFTEHDSRKILHIAANPQVNVTISAPVSATRLTPHQASGWR